MMDGFLNFHLFLRKLGYLLVRKPSWLNRWYALF